MVRSASSRVSNHERQNLILRDAAKRLLLRMRLEPLVDLSYCAFCFNSYDTLTETRSVSSP